MSFTGISQIISGVPRGCQTLRVLNNNENTCAHILVYQILQKTSLYDYMPANVKTLLASSMWDTDVSEESCIKIPNTVAYFYKELTGSVLKPSAHAWNLLQAFVMCAPREVYNKMKFILAVNKTIADLPETMSLQQQELINSNGCRTFSFVRSPYKLEIKDTDTAVQGVNQLKSAVISLYEFVSTSSGHLIGGWLGWEANKNGEPVRHGMCFVRCEDDLIFYNWGSVMRLSTMYNKFATNEQADRREVYYFMVGRAFGRTKYPFGITETGLIFEADPPAESVAYEHAKEDIISGVRHKTREYVDMAASWLGSTPPDEN